MVKSSWNSYQLYSSFCIVSLVVRCFFDIIFPSRAPCSFNAHIIFHCDIVLEQHSLTNELILLFRLFQPEGAANHNHIIQYALALVRLIKRGHITYIFTYIMSNIFYP